jgi:hypothetical protein
MSWLGNVLGFEKFHGKQILKDLKDKPTRLLTGVDPASTKLWNKVLGTNDKPIVDQMGGATGDRYRAADAAGIDYHDAKGMQNVAHVVAALYGAQGLAGAAGNLMGSAGSAAAGGEAGAAGAAGGGTSGSGLLGNAAVGNADKAAMFGNAGYGEGMTGAQTGAYDASLGGGGMDWQGLMKQGMKSFNQNQQQQQSQNSSLQSSLKSNEEELLRTQMLTKALRRDNEKLPELFNPNPRRY